MHLISTLLQFVSRYRRIVSALALLLIPVGTIFAYHSSSVPSLPQAPSAGRSSHSPTAPHTSQQSSNNTLRSPSPTNSAAPTSVGTSSPAGANQQSPTKQSSGTTNTTDNQPNTVTLSCPSGQIGTPPNCTTPPPTPLGLTGNWNLILRDEFDTLNTALWTTQRGPSSYSYGDPYNPSLEDAYYLANNPKVANGNLVLTLNQGTTNGYPYSSGMVQNGRNFSYKYGYVEARIKVPGNTGVWPAFWTLAAPVDQYWPPEIDIFEFGLSSQTRPAFNYHYGSAPNNHQMGLVTYGNAATDYTQGYHVYGMLWSSSKIQVYIDGEPGPSYTNAANITSLPQYIIFNLALKKGYIVPSGTAMYVDYVRVWQ